MKFGEYYGWVEYWLKDFGMDLFDAKILMTRNKWKIRGLFETKNAREAARLLFPVVK